MSTLLLQRGSRGPEVAELQRHLGITADGIFGRETAAALTSRQRQLGIAADGIFGPQSRSALFGGSSRTSLPSPIGSGSTLLRRGSRGPEVVALQRHLGITADGIFGRETAAALTSRQRQLGIAADGIFGPQSRSALFGGSSRTSLPSPIGSGSTLLRRGSRGPEVMALQRRLGITADGIFGRETAAALTSRQRQLGIAADGIFGPQSRSALFGGLSRTSLPSPIGSGATLLRRGSRGPEVVALQRRLGITADGIFGRETAAALTSRQRQLGIAADGIFGPQSRSALFGGSSRISLPSPIGSGTPHPTMTGDLTRNFSLREFRCNDSRQTSVPIPFQGNVRKLATNLQTLRDSLGGKSITIRSGYRTLEHNAAVGGKAHSRHLVADAADIVVKDVAPREVRSKILQLISEGRMDQGGVGIYNNFVHYDVRGKAARWDGTKSKKPQQ